MDTEEKAKEILNQIIKTIDNNCVELVKKVKKNMKKNISDSALCNKALEYYYDKFDNGIIKAKDKFALVWGKLISRSIEASISDKIEEIDYELLKKLTRLIIAVVKSKEDHANIKGSFNYLQKCLENIKKHEDNNFQANINKYYEEYESIQNSFA